MAADAQQSTSSSLNVCLRIKAQKHEEKAASAYHVINDKSFSVKTWKNEVIYNFSRIFGPDTDQQEIFEASAGSSIRSFLQGTDCLIMAYGTTNAGKTYTVQGNSQNPGIVPRTVVSIFDAIKGHIDSSSHIAPCNYSTTQIQTKKDKHRIDTLRAYLLGSSQCKLANCSVSFSSALSSTVLTDFGLGTREEISSLEPDVAVEEFGWKPSTRCSIWLSMIEIYNECVFDLLSQNKAASKVFIKSDLDGRFYPTGHIEVPVNSLEEAKAIIQFGNRNRTKSSTLLNSTSSRSHCILRLRLVRADRAPGGPTQMGPQSPAAFDIQDTNVSTFLICDLAGAERTNKTGDAKGRARETATINNALVVLGRCITVLKQIGASGTHRSAVVPFRESKLTRILQPLLSDLGPKHFLININTSPNLLEETLNVLNFSSVARKVVVVEQIKSVPHYQLPVSEKQLQAMYESQLMKEKDSVEASKTDIFEDDDELNSNDVNEIIKYTVGTQTEPMEIDFLIHNAEHSKGECYEEIGVQTDQDEQLSENDKISNLKRLLIEKEHIIEENQAKFREREKTLFAEFDQWVQEIEGDHKISLENKESQLYNLMERRLDIQKKFYEEKIVDLQTVKNSLEDKLLNAEKDKNNAEIMLDFATGTIEELKDQNELLTKERNNLQEEVIKRLEESISLKNQMKEEREAAAVAFTTEIKNLEKAVKDSLVQIVELNEKLEKAEQSSGKLQKRNGNLMSALEEKTSELQRCKQIVEYLVDQFRPDMRKSLASCADEELAWQQLLQEIKTIPSQCAQLSNENHELKKQLELKDQDLVKFKELRDGLLNKYEKELSFTKMKLEEYKRECQILNKRMLCMTPRQQDITPKKEFKTPLTPKQNTLINHNSSSPSKLLDEAEEELAKPLKCNQRQNLRRTPSRSASTNCVKENLQESMKETELPNSKPRRRRLLRSATLHPALDCSEEPVHCELQSKAPLSDIKRRLRVQYK